MTESPIIPFINTKRLTVVVSIGIIQIILLLICWFSTFWIFTAMDPEWYRMPAGLLSAFGIGLIGISIIAHITYTYESKPYRTWLYTHPPKHFPDT